MFQSQRITHEQVLAANTAIVRGAHLRAIKDANNFIRQAYVEEGWVFDARAVALDGPKLEGIARLIYDGYMSEVQLYSMILNYPVMGKHQSRHLKAINGLLNLWNT